MYFILFRANGIYIMVLPGDYQLIKLTNDLVNLIFKHKENKKVYVYVNIRFDF